MGISKTDDWKGSIQTPLGGMWATGNHATLRSLCFKDNPNGQDILESQTCGVSGELLHPRDSAESSPIFTQLCDQLRAYFEGEIKEFSIPLDPQGTDFQKRVWKALMDIEYGQTSFYSDLALKIRNVKASRAIGNALHQNPITLIIPCHRVIAKNKKGGGYAGGLSRKNWLLSHEASGSLAAFHARAS